VADAIRRAERGSVLFLFPAAFLIVLVLGAIAIDSGAAFLRQRELAAAADAAANDAITLAVHDSIALGAAPAIDPAAADEAVRQSLARRGVLDGLSAPPRVTVVASDRLEVHLEAVAEYVIAPALPGGVDGTPVEATVTVRLAVDDG
jgi:Flp pilus assembly protein TadG